MAQRSRLAPKRGNVARRVGVGCLGAAGFGITGFDESFWGSGRERRRTRPVASTTRAAIPRGAAGEVDRERESGSSASFAGCAGLRWVTGWQPEDLGPRRAVAVRLPGHGVEASASILLRHRTRDSAVGAE